MNEISQIKQYASRNAVPIMKDEGMEFMCSLIRDNKFVRILEIGSAIGYSAIQFASAAENVEVTTVEIDIDRYSKAVRNILDCGLKDRIKINCADALDWVPEEGSQFDLIFIDAAKAQYIKFFQKFKKYLAPGGVIVSDNLAFHGMVNDFSLTHNYSTIKLLRKIKKYVSFLKLNPEFNTEFFDVGDGVSVSRKNMEFLKLNFTQLESREATSYFSVANGGEVVGKLGFVKKQDKLILRQLEIESKFVEDWQKYVKYFVMFAWQNALEQKLHFLNLETKKSQAQKFIDIGFYVESETDDESTLSLRL